MARGIFSAVDYLEFATQPGNYPGFEVNLPIELQLKEFASDSHPILGKVDIRIRRIFARIVMLEGWMRELGFCPVGSSEKIKSADVRDIEEMIRISKTLSGNFIFLLLSTYSRKEINEFMNHKRNVQLPFLLRGTYVGLQSQIR